MPRLEILSDTSSTFWPISRQASAKSGEGGRDEEDKNNRAARGLTMPSIASDFGVEKAVCNVKGFGVEGIINIYIK